MITRPSTKESDVKKKKKKNYPSKDANELWINLSAKFFVLK